MYKCHGVGPHGNVEKLPGEFTTLEEAMKRIAGAIQFIDTSLYLSGMKVEILSGTNWMSVRDTVTGMSWKLVAEEVSKVETPTFHPKVAGNCR